MGSVETVTGTVDGADLGRTLVHEHIQVLWPGHEFDRRPSLKRADLVAMAVDKLAALVDEGFRTFVDPCPIELGRDPELYAAISQGSGMHIICTTGFYTGHEGSGLPFYWRGREPDEIAELYVAELQEGIGETGIKPGAIKAATGLEVTPSERRALIGAAMAQRETGVAIITHTENSRHGDLQQETFHDGGADLGRVLIGHQDEQTEVAGIRKLAERGSFVGIDRIGLEILAPDERRADHVAALVEQGFTSQICLSQDHICRPMTLVDSTERRNVASQEVRDEMDWQLWRRPHTYIATEFIPLLREHGVAQADIETMLVDNPRRLLSGE